MAYQIDLIINKFSMRTSAKSKKCSLYYVLLIHKCWGQIAKMSFIYTFSHILKDLWKTLSVFPEPVFMDKGAQIQREESQRIQSHW